MNIQQSIKRDFKWGTAQEKVIIPILRKHYGVRFRQNPNPYGIIDLQSPRLNLEIKRVKRLYL